MFLLVLCVCVYGWVCNGREGRLAYDFLDELRKEFLNSHGGQVARASRPYEFIRFGTFATGLRTGRLRYGVNEGWPEGKAVVSAASRGRAEWRGFWRTN